MRVSIAYEMEIPDERLAVETARLIEQDKDNLATEFSVGGKLFYACVVAVSITEKRKSNQWTGPWLNKDERQMEFSFK